MGRMMLIFGKFAYIILRRAKECSRRTSILATSRRPWTSDSIGRCYEFKGVMGEAHGIQFKILNFLLVCISVLRSVEIGLEFFSWGSFGFYFSPVGMSVLGVWEYLGKFLLMGQF